MESVRCPTCETSKFSCTCTERCPTCGELLDSSRVLCAINPHGCHPTSYKHYQKDCCKCDGYYCEGDDCETLRHWPPYTEDCGQSDALCSAHTCCSECCPGEEGDYCYEHEWNFESAEHYYGDQYRLTFVCNDCEHYGHSFSSENIEDLGTQ